MKSKFTTPCFIHRNTPELRRKLEELGYNHRQQWPDKNKDKCRILFVDNGSYFYHYVESRPKAFFETHIDCGENEALFLAIAALREDSDYMQWFIDKRGVFVQCRYGQIREFIDIAAIHGYDIGGDWLRKATIEELINHFKD